ncbi:MAG: hypothetical protein J6Q03_08230 [Paludibacteraceae bacterium]|nr:hypothetical protein [Paludibacteraceae bacterium]
MFRNIFIIVFAISASVSVSAGDMDSVFYDYPLMKSQISLMKKNLNERTVKKNVVVSDSTISFENKDGYVFDIKIKSYESDINKTHKFIAEVLSPNNKTILNIDVPSFFNMVVFEVLKFRDYMFFEEIEFLCQLLKEKMVKPFELLKKNEHVEDVYYDSCFELFKESNSYSLVLEACNEDFPHESLSFICFDDGRCVFEYSFSLP